MITLQTCTFAHVVGDTAVIFRGSEKKHGN